MMRSYYNGYRFSIRATEKVYNPTMSLYFFKSFQRDCRYPEPMLDSNLAMDAEKVRFIADIGQRGEGFILDIVQGNRIGIFSLQDRFTIHDLLYMDEQDISSQASYLYYFGVLTLVEKTLLEYCLEVPNLVIRGLYVERIRKFLSDAIVQNEGGRQAQEFLLNGDIAPLCQFIEQKILPTFKNREYRWMNEFSLKVMFLCYLFWENMFMIDSEPPPLNPPSPQPPKFGGQGGRGRGGGERGRRRGGKGVRCPPMPSIATMAMAHLPMSPARQAWETQATALVARLVTTITMGMSICT
jgi:hypothetical protein